MSMEKWNRFLLLRVHDCSRPHDSIRHGKMMRAKEHRRLKILIAPYFSEEVLTQKMRQTKRLIRSCATVLNSCVHPPRATVIIISTALLSIWRMFTHKCVRLDPRCEKKTLPLLLISSRCILPTNCCHWWMHLMENRNNETINFLCPLMMKGRKKCVLIVSILKRLLPSSIWVIVAAWLNCYRPDPSRDRNDSIIVAVFVLS